MKKHANFNGLFCATVTPLNSGRIDLKRLQMHIQTLAADGCNGLVIAGTTGEGQSFDLAERGELLSAARESCGNMTLLAGTGCANLPDTIHSTRQAYALGADGVLMVPPFFFRDATTAGLAEYFRIVYAEAVPASGGALLYHIPQVTGVPISQALLKQVQDNVGEKLAGVKDSSGDRAAFLDLCRSFPELCIFSGLEDFLLEGLQNGASGCITAGANVLAAPTAALIRAYRAGEDASSMQEHLLKARVVLPHTPYPVALKGLLAARYNDPAWLEVRPPLLPLAPADQDILVSELRGLDLR